MTAVNRWGENGPRPLPDPAFDDLFAAMTAQAEVRVECPSGRAWDLVSDITRIGEFSPECVGAQWLAGSGPGVVGARFEGTNRVARGDDERVWVRPCEVLAWEPGRRFAYAVGDRFDGTPASTWEFHLEPDGDATVIRQLFAHRPDGQSGIRTGAEADPDHAAEFVAARRDELESAMALTLARMKAVLEA